MARHRIPKVTAVLLVIAAALCACASPRTARIAPSAIDQAYVLDRGDRLRINVFGQPSLTSTYAIDPAGIITFPLVGAIEAAGQTTGELQKRIEARLRQGYLRDPNVTVEVDSYRPFFILGEVEKAGQFPYEPGLTAEKAIAIAGGFSPRASRDSVDLTRRIQGRMVKVAVPLATPVRPGDVVTVRERWF
jgi:polysaccharide export outer membrane protein